MDAQGQKLDKHFELLSQGQKQAWEGREIFAGGDLALVDWYHNATGQDCPKSKRADWMKALNSWRSNGLTVADLQAAYDMDINWRKVFTSPNQLTDKALALRAQKKAPAQSTRPEHQPYKPQEGNYVPRPKELNVTGKIKELVQRSINGNDPLSDPRTA